MYTKQKYLIWRDLLIHETCSAHTLVYLQRNAMNKRKIFSIFVVVAFHFLGIVQPEPCGAGVCQNGGKCALDGNTNKCICPCSFTGDFCEYNNWCSNATFKNVGCFATAANMDELFVVDGSSFVSDIDQEWNWFLKNVTCACAASAKEKGYQHFSVRNEGSCVGFRDRVFAAGDKEDDGCRGEAPNRNQCNDVTFVPCIGSSTRDYVYELSARDQRHRATSDYADCSDYDYTVRLRVSSGAKHPLSPIINGLPTTPSFSFCTWLFLLLSTSRRCDILSYWQSTDTDHFIFGLRTFNDGSELHVAVRGIFLNEMVPIVTHSQWRHVCGVVNFDLPTNQVTWFIDGDVGVTFAHSSWGSLNEGGKLVIGRSQDTAGNFNNDCCMGEFVSLNIWDTSLSGQDIKELYQNSVGTETGNYLAWPDIKRYLRNPVPLGDRPSILKWTGKGCVWEDMTCDTFGDCRGGLFRCPYSNSAVAPRSCTSSEHRRHRLCSDHNYVLSFENTDVTPGVVLSGFVRATFTMTICFWIKIAQRATDYGSQPIVFQLQATQPIFKFNLGSNRLTYCVYMNGAQNNFVIPNVFTDNKWRSICITTTRPGGLTVYENGISVGQSTLSNVLMSGSATLYIGPGPVVDPTSPVFDGSLAHFNMWNFVLDSTSLANVAEGAYTHVGNVISWPQVREHVQTHVRLRKGSPVMKWTGLGCTWSGYMCEDNQFCEAATLICPEVNETQLASPESCADFSYVGTEDGDGKDWQHNYASVLLFSRGFYHMREEFTSILVNNKEHRLTSFGNFLVLNAITGELENEFTCNTHQDGSCGEKITQFVDSLHTDVVVLFANLDEPEMNYQSRVTSFKQLVGDSTYITDQTGYRHAQAFIGYKGTTGVTWTSSKHLLAPTLIKATIPLIRESCLDLLYMGARQNGLYDIYPSGTKSLTVYCDFTLNGGGWTLIQRRHEGKVTFSRNLQQYKDGFGPVSGEFWLGNDNIAQLGNSQLLITMMSSNMYTTYEVYNSFAVEGDVAEVSGHSGIKSNGSLRTGSLSFEVYGDNAQCTQGKGDGGWWFDTACNAVNLNSNKAKCDKEFLITEMMMRPRYPSHDIAVKTVDNDITYAQAVALCEGQQLRLCSSAEVCRDGKNPYGGVRNLSSFFVPVSDAVDNWMQIGADDANLCLKSSYTALTDVKEVLCCKQAQSPNIVQRTWKYDLEFTSTTGHVRLPRLTPLLSFSICFWASLNHGYHGWKTVFSLWSIHTKNRLLELLLTSQGDYQLIFDNHVRQFDRPTQFIERNQYYHTCLTMKNNSGIVNLYLDGTLLTSFNNIDHTPFLSDGVLVIGQSLKTISEFDDKHAFHGIITRFNIWDSELSADNIEQYSLVCGEEEGNIVAWPEVKLWKTGLVAVNEGEPCFPLSCLDYLYRGKKHDGVYKIKPNRNDTSFPVYCDQSSLGGGWTVFGKRFDGSVPFHEKNWDEYKIGFGDLNGEFWLGNEHIHVITGSQKYQLHITGDYDDGNTFSILYDNFVVHSEAQNYMETWQYSTPSTEQWRFNSGRLFATTDRDNTPQNCTTDGYTVSWFRPTGGCLQSNIFGVWGSTAYTKAQWDSNKNLIRVELKIRPMKYIRTNSSTRYVTNTSGDWGAVQKYCEEKKSWMCSSGDFCSNYPLGGVVSGTKTVAVGHSTDVYFNIGLQSTCKKGLITDSSSYAFCCKVFRNMDWRYDLRFRGNGFLKIAMPKRFTHMSLRIWLRVSKADHQDRVTIFTYITKSNQKIGLQWRHGYGVIKFIDSSSTKAMTELKDGEWHQVWFRQSSDDIELFVDDDNKGKFYSSPFQFESGVMTIGQDVDEQSGEFVANRGLIGELSRFDIWPTQIAYDTFLNAFAENYLQISMVMTSWPLFKYHITNNDIEYLPGLTGYKTTKYRWLLNEVNSASNTYDELYGSGVNFEIQNPTVAFEADGAEPSIPMALKSNRSHLRTLQLYDSFIVDPELSARTGMTVAFWLKQKGLVSSILPESDGHYETLMKWLDETAPTATKWLPCYSSSGAAFSTTDFHTNCNSKGPTVTLVKSGRNIFGGFSNEDWGGGTRHLSSHSSFLFSLYNPDNTGPVKMEVMDQANHTALYLNDEFGPTFGENYDLKIGDSTSSVCCSSNLGQTYHVPSGYTQGANEAKYFFTSTEEFSIDEIEVYYAHVAVQTIGVNDPSVTSDDQMTASSFSLYSTGEPHEARLKVSGGSWYAWHAAITDESPWLQVELVDVARIGRIDTRGCKHYWVEQFMIHYSLDALSWLPYMENISVKVFDANTEGLAVKENILQLGVETKFVKFVVSEYSGRACMTFELYSNVESCPVTFPSIDTCVAADEASCLGQGCCYEQGSSRCALKETSLQPLGVASGAIPDGNFKASSSAITTHAPYNCRYGRGGWLPATTDTDPWIQVEFNQDEVLTHIRTTGHSSGAEHYPYFLHYRRKNTNFTVYKENGRDKLFTSYTDRLGNFYYMFLKTIVARFVRVYPVMEAGKTYSAFFMEFFRAVPAFDVIFGVSRGRLGRSGPSLYRRAPSGTVFTIQTDSETLELSLDHIPYHWTHFTFTWSKKAGIQCYKNGVWLKSSASPKVNKNNPKTTGALFYVGDSIWSNKGAVYSIYDLHIIKQQLLPSEVKSSLLQGVCDLDNTVTCVKDQGGWLITMDPTPTTNTGPSTAPSIQGDNLAFLRAATQTGASNYSDLGVDGNIYGGVPSSLCTSITEAGVVSWWQVDLATERKVDMVDLLRQDGFEPWGSDGEYEVLTTALVVPGESFELCSDDLVQDISSYRKSYRCKPDPLSQYVRIRGKDISTTLAFCEVAVYSLEPSSFAVLESSYPKVKGDEVEFTTDYIIKGYNCLTFSYHMYGSTMGKLNVFVVIDDQKQLVWRLAGHQGDHWLPARVKVGTSRDIEMYQISFDGIVGDGHLSDIAFGNISFSVDSQCYTLPSQASPSIQVIEREDVCHCVSHVGASPVISSDCSLASPLTWLQNGLLQIQQQCIQPTNNHSLDGSQLVLVQPCDHANAMFRLLPNGAIQHHSSKLCIQPSKWLFKYSNVPLVLTRLSCDYTFWKYTPVLLKDNVEPDSYNKQFVLRLGSNDAKSCYKLDSIVLPYIALGSSIQTDGQVLALNADSEKFKPALLNEVNGTHATVTFVSQTESTILNMDQVSRTVTFTGSSMLPWLTATYTSTIASWMAERGVFVPHWQPCVTLLPDNTYAFSCSDDLPTLVLTRIDREIFGGFKMNNLADQNPSEDFLFSLKGDVFNKFNNVGDTLSIMDASAIRFGQNNDELSLVWNAVVPTVTTRAAGASFQTTSDDLILGQENYIPTHFEVLQPFDYICLPSCRANSVCDDITGNCDCDFTNRPPSWCWIGATEDTIYKDADHYWSLDSTRNIFNLKQKSDYWAIIKGDISNSDGVNSDALEIQNGDNEVVLLSDDTCLKETHSCPLTVTFWFKNDPRQSTENVYVYTGSTSAFGFCMRQSANPDEMELARRSGNTECIDIFNVEPNLWTLLAIRINTAGTFDVFINGENIALSSECVQGSTFPNIDPAKFVLTNAGEDSTVYFDDVAIWYRSLEDTKIEEIYNYYYKAPKRTLVAKLVMSVTDFPWHADIPDKETVQFVNLRERIFTTFESLFTPDKLNRSSVFFDNCRPDGASTACDVELYISSYEYAVLDIIDNPGAANIAFTALTTEHIPYVPVVVSGLAIDPFLIQVNMASAVHKLRQGFVLRYTNLKTNISAEEEISENINVYNMTDLNAYTQYEISMAEMTLAGVGPWSTPIIVETEEDVPSFAPTNLTGHNTSSTEIVFEWEAVEVEDIYESLRGYVIYLTEAHNSSHIIQNITTDANTLSVTFDNLRKFSTYTVYVRALSVDVGNKSIELNITTAEDVPEGPPQNLTGFNSSSTSIRLDFRPVSQDLINGILRGYRVFYFKTREGNDTRKNLTIQERASEGRKKRSVDEYYDNYPLFVELTGLDEYTNYTFQIQAITIGPGVLSPPSTIMTDEDVPSVSPPNITAVNTSSTSILLEWRLMAEEDMNGVLLGYIIYYNTSMNGDESSFLHISSNFSAEITGLEKYTIYGFQMTAFTRIGEGPRSPVLYCTTDEDVPSAPPQEIQAVPTSRIKMAIYWKAVPFPFQHGKILGYHFIFSTMSGEVIVNKILPPDQMLIHVSDLDIFTNYTVNVTAFNSKGNGTWGTLTPTSFQLAPIVAPLNLTARSFSTNSSLPLSWVGVPANLTQGYILGYKIYLKLISVGLEKVYNQPERIIDLKGSHHSSCVIEGLDYFSEYGMYVVAYTIQGESPRSNYVHAETCRCEKVLSSQWRNVAPYTNITEAGSADAETIRTSWGIFPYIINDIIQFCCRSCDTHNQSSVDYENNGHRQQSEFFNDPQLNMAVDDVTDITFPVYGYEGMTIWRDSHPFLSLVVSPGTVYIVKKEEVSSMLTTLISNIFGNWSVLLLMLSLAMAAGAIMWLLEFRENPDEYSPNVLRGIGSGFWWAYVSMTTVGYGDKTARSVPGRIFAIMWVLTGLVITGIMIGNLASSLTVSVSSVEKIIYGANVGALSYSPSHRLGVRMNAKMNVGDRQYLTNEDLQKALLSGEVEGILVDGYMVGEYDNLYKHPKLMLNRIKDFKSSYGIVWSGKSKRLSVCLKWYMAQRKTFIFSHIERNLNFPKKIAQLDMSEEMSDLFDPSNELFQKTIKICLLTLAVFLVLGSIYEFVRRKRSSAKVLPGSIEQQNMKRCKMVAMKDYFNKSLTDINDKLVNLKRRHVKQLGRLL